MNSEATAKIYALVFVVALALLGAMIVPSLAEDGNDEGTTLCVFKTAEGFSTVTEDVEWSMEKTASPSSLELNRGETGTVTYTIDVSKEVTLSPTVVYGVSGVINVWNCGDEDTSDLAITDTIMYRMGDGEWQELATYNVDTSVKPILLADEEWSYAYSFNFIPVDGVDVEYKNTAAVSITNLKGHSGDAFETVVEKDFVIPTSPEVIGPSCCLATVSDSLVLPDGFEVTSDAVGPWEFTESGSVSYEVTIMNVDAPWNGCFDAVNTAELERCDGCLGDSVSVTVELCTPEAPALVVTKTGPEFSAVGHEIVWDITIENTGGVDFASVAIDDPLVGLSDEIALGAGEAYSFNVSYMVPEDSADEICNEVFVTGDVFDDDTEIVEASASHCVFIMKPCIEVTKSAPEMSAPGHNITWEIAVTNCGNVDLEAVAIDDPAANYFEIVAIAAGDTYSVTLETTVPEDFVGDEVCNVVFVTVDLFGDEHCVLEASAEACVAIAQPCISVVKTGPATAAPGDTIVWDITVTNCGNVDLASVLIDDPAAEYSEVISLAIGAEYSFSLETMVPVDCTADEICNTVYVTADTYGDEHCLLYAEDTWCVDIERVCLEVYKTAAEMSAPGHEIEWAIAIYNCGNVDLEEVAIDDPAAGYFEIAAIPMGSWYNITLVTLVPEDFVGDEVCNTVFVTVDGVEYSAEACVAIAQSCIEVFKTAPESVGLGDTIVWEIAVHNCGNVDIATVAIDDPAAGYFEIIALGAGEWYNFTLETEVPMEMDGDYICNEVFVTADTFGDEHCILEAYADTCVFIAQPAVCVDKTGPDTAAPGETITYEFTVTNCGNVDLSDVVFTDPLFGDDWSYYIGDLAVGESVSFSESYTIPEDFTGVLPNVGVVTGEDDFETPVDDDDEHDVEVRDFCANCLEITKYGPAEAFPGDTIFYEITVRNICASPLSNIHVVDDMLGLDEWIYCLMPCDYRTFVVPYTIPADFNYCEDGEYITNTAVADGWCCNHPCQEEATWTMHVNVDCIIDIVKVGPEMAEVGETIDFTITVSNLGKCNLICVEVKDTVFDMYCGILFEEVIWEIGDLPSCTSVTKTFSYTVPADWTICKNGYELSNEAYVEGYCCCRDRWVWDLDTADVFIKTCGNMVLEKTGPLEAERGDVIEYTITVWNIGACPISCLEVSDPLLGFYEEVCCLMPCESITWKASLDTSWWSYCEYGDYLTNTVTATGWACDMPVMEEDSWSVLMHDCPHLEVMKTGPADAYAGQDVVYTITVMNMGSCGIGCIDVWDNATGFHTFVEYLPSCESVTFEVPFTIPADWCCAFDGEYFVNTAEATGWNCGTPVKAVDTWMTLIHCPCCLDVTVTVPSEVCPGEWIVGTVCVTNCGNYTIVNITVSDDCGLLNEKICVLEPGESVCYTVEYYVCCPCDEDGDDARECCGGGYWLYNSFSAVGYCCPCDTLTSDVEPVAVYVKPCCELTLYKTGPTEAVPGETVTWTLTAINTGCCDLRCLHVWDPMVGFEVYEPDLILAAGDSVSYDVQWTMPADWSYCDGPVTNDAYAEAYCCCCEMWVKACDDLTIYPIDPCDLRISKEIINEPCVDLLEAIGCHCNGFAPGETIFYEITVSNMGSNCISCIHVEDEAIGFYEFIYCLAPCTSVTFVVEYTIPYDWTYCANGEYFNNTATAFGWCCGQYVEVSDTTSAKVCACCSIEVYKTGPETASPGDTITYEISVYNSGKYPLCCVDVYDNLWTMPGGMPTAIAVDGMQVDCMFCGINEWFFWQIPCLQPCEWYNISFEYTVPEDWTYCCNGDILYNDVYVDAQCCHVILCDWNYFDVQIVDIPATVEIYKSSMWCMAVPGDTVYYDIWVHNPNEYALSCVHVWDPLLGIDEIICCMEPCEWIYLWGEYTIPADWCYCEDGEWLTNTAYVEAYYFDQYVTDEDSWTINVLDLCDLRIFKTADVEEAYPGDIITYTITVKNCGMNPICCVEVSDPMLGLDEYIPCMLPCDEYTWTLEYMVPEDWTYCANVQTDGYLVNTAYAMGYCCDSGVKVKATEGVYIHCEACLQVFKNGPETASPGDTILYEIMVCNCGSNAVGCVYLTDDLAPGYVYLGNEMIMAEADGRYNLGCFEPCECKLVTFEYTIPADYCCCEDAELCNTAFAEGYMMDVYVSDEDTFCTTVLAPCKLMVEKFCGDDDCIVYPGQTLTYTIYVYNIGTEVLTGLHVSDPLLGFEAEDLEPFYPGETRWWQVEYTVPELQPGECIDGSYEFVNTVYARASCTACPDCCCVEATGTHVLTVLSPCCIDVEKYVLNDGPIGPGDTIGYRIDVTNCGIVSLSMVKLWDPLLGISNMTVDDGCLAAGETVSLYYKYVVPEDWTWCAYGEGITNEVWVSGSCCWCEVEDYDEIFTPIVSPNLQVIKEGPAEAAPGDVVTYTITVRNVGPTPVCCLNIVDPMIGFHEYVMCLLPCDEVSYTVDYAIPECWTYCKDGEYLNNTATAMGYTCGQRIMYSDDWSILMDVDFQLYVFKYARMPCFDLYSPGDTVYYQIIVANMGKMPMNNVKVYDPLLGWEASIDCLDSCEKMSWIVPYTIPCDWSFCEDGAYLNNTVYAEGWGCGNMYTAESSWSIFVEDIFHIEVIKEGPTEEVCPGDTVEFTITVKNLGMAPICCLRIVDVIGNCKVGVEVLYDEYIWCLMPCTSFEFTVEYTIPADWSYCYDGEGLINIVFVGGVGCYDYALMFMENPIVWDIDWAGVMVNVDCCPYDGDGCCPA